MEQQDTDIMNMNEWLHQLREKWLPDTDDQAWRDWVDMRPRTLVDVVDLYTIHEIRDSIRARVLFLMLVPERKWIPFYWNQAPRVRVIGTFWNKDIQVKLLSPALQEYVAELIIQFIDVLQPMHDREIAQQTESRYTYHDALECYHSRIRELLPLLPEETADRLFARYSLVDISPVRTEDDPHLTPLQVLLHDRSLDESWKWKADLRVRELIMAEHDGTYRPRREWEKVLVSYMDILGMMMYLRCAPYSFDLLISQFEFLISLQRAWSNFTIREDVMILLLKLLGDDAYRAARLRLSRFMVLENNNTFSIDSSENAKLTRQVIADCADDDPTLKNYLTEQLMSYEREQEAVLAERQPLIEKARAQYAAKQRILDALK